MASRTELPPCAPKVFRKGTCVFMGHPDVPLEEMEEWVKKVAKISGQPVDWHVAGGNRRVLALGDLDAVHDAIDELWPDYEKLEDDSRSPLEAFHGCSKIDRVQ